MMTKTKLTDTQLVILSNAAQQDSFRVLPLPESLTANAGALKVAVKSLLDRELIMETPANPGDEIWREDDPFPYTLGITRIGLEAIRAEPDTEPTATTHAAGPSSDQAVQSPDKAGSKVVALRPKSRGSSNKTETLVRLLSRKSGASLTDLMAATGWQAHSVRGAISGTLKKKHGLIIESHKTKAGERVYRCVTEAAS